MARSSVSGQHGSASPPLLCVILFWVSLAVCSSSTPISAVISKKSNSSPTPSIPAALALWFPEVEALCLPLLFVADASASCAGFSRPHQQICSRPPYSLDRASNPAIIHLVPPPARTPARTPPEDGPMLRSHALLPAVLLVFMTY